jgi:hypothetical protein
MSDMYGQYGKFVDDTTWEYFGAWSHYHFDMKNMKCEKTVRDGTIENLPIMILNGNIEIVGMSKGFGPPIQAEYKRYQHWLFERVVLLEE